VTQNLERAGPVGTGEPGPDLEANWRASTDTRRRSWWQRPWLLPVGVVVVWFLFYVWPPYLGLDPSTAVVPLRPDVAVHYPLMVAHIMFGTIALLTVVLQVWPWLRRNYPVAHRWIGRVYVFGGALPACIIALLITPLSVAPSVGTTVGGIFWLITTVMGYIRIRQRRIADHRRWMLYSFAMALNIIWGRIFAVLLPLTPFGDSQAAVGHVFGAAPWIGWVINLILVQWWLNRTANRPVAQLV
jgi:uncharacterized membrane protein YozB (DUF420 family)